MAQQQSTVAFVKSTWCLFSTLRHIINQPALIFQAGGKKVMLMHISNAKVKKAFLVQRPFWVCCAGRVRDHNVGDCGLQVVPDTKLLIKHLKLVWQGAPYMKCRLVVP